jgi:hypothetical protein
MVVIDEFLAGNEKGAFSLEKPLYVLHYMMNRTVRNYATLEPKVFIVGNPHNNVESDILSSLKIYPDKTKLYNRQDEILVSPDNTYIYLSFPSTTD